MHSVREHIAQAEFESLPTAARQALTGLEVDFLDNSSSMISIQASSVGSWWFALVEGHGLIRHLLRERPNPGMYTMLAITLNGQHRTMQSPMPRAGEMVLLPWEGPSDTIFAGEFRYLIAHIPVEVLRETMQDWDTPVMLDSPLSAFMGAGALLYANLRGLAEQARNMTLRPELELLLPDIARLILRSFSPNVVNSACREFKQNMFGRILTYMEANLGYNQLSAELVSSACGISERQLFRFFQDHNESFSGTLRRMRLARAQDMLLLNTNSTLAQISEMTGFSTPAYFSRIFTSEIGCTPSRFRRQAVWSGKPDDRPEIGFDSREEILSELGLPL